MIDLEKPKTPGNKKPPTQIAGVTGIDSYKPMDSKPPIDWYKLCALPPFEMFMMEQTGQTNANNIIQWAQQRAEALGADKFYQLYADWHEAKGYWVNETPMGELK